jgi:hypothetical protein
LRAPAHQPVALAELEREHDALEGGHGRDPLELTATGTPGAGAAP